MILLLADVEELKADVDVPASGLVIEAHVEQGRGSVAHALIEAGVLKPGDFVVAGSSYAKVRNLEDTEGRPLKAARPSTPVVMTGFKTLPEFADEFVAVDSEKAARLQANANAQAKVSAGGRHGINSTELIRLINRNNEVQELNVLIKADVQGSLTSVIDSLKALDTEEVAVRIVGTGIGAVTENDVHLAQTSGAVIYGFNTTIPGNIRQIASRDKVKIRLYKIIYELIDDVKSELSELLLPQVVTTDLGRLVIKGVFKTTRTEIICGGEVTKGKLTLPAFANVYRGDDQLAEEIEVTNLKRGPQDAKEVVEGELCGVNLKTDKRLELQEGDRLEFYRTETVERSL
jgi:translation initiation factor IF-2